MWFNQCHFYHQWLGMVNIAPIKMVMTGGWFIIVLTTLIQERNMSRWFFTNQYFMYFIKGFWTLLCSIWCAFEVSPVTFCWFTCGVQHGTLNMEYIPTFLIFLASWMGKMPRSMNGFLGGAYLWTQNVEWVTQPAVHTWNRCHQLRNGSVLKHQIQQCRPYFL